MFRAVSETTSQVYMYTHVHVALHLYIVRVSERRAIKQHAMI